MKKLLISVLCIGMIFLSTGCSNSKSYNTTYDDSARANTDDVRTLTGDTFDSSFELVSYEKVDETTSIYIVRDKTTNKEYILVETINGVSITERIK